VRTHRFWSLTAATSSLLLLGFSTFLSAEEEVPPPPINYFIQSRAYGTQPETEPPRYVRSFNKDLYWLDFGVDHRTRFEYRDGDFRRSEQVLDLPFLIRHRAYVGVREVFDPFRLGIELQDSRLTNSQFPDTTRDVNEYDVLQAFGELFFKHALGDNRPLRLQVGRLAFEYMDRRLISRNPWRNTTNNFQGARLILGQQPNDWQLDVLALRPVRLRLDGWDDRADRNQFFLGAIGAWRRWSQIMTFEPYYLVLDRKEDATRPAHLQEKGIIHTVGLRAYGMTGASGLDYDFNVTGQFGDDGPRRRQAIGAAAELGYVFEHPWKPRVSGFFGYASGDDAADDNKNTRFDRLFGFARPWSANDYMVYENLIAPKARLEFQPHSMVRVDTAVGAFWQASRTDLWLNARRQDPTGQSGSFIGYEYDLRVRLQPDPRVAINLGYAHFFAGEFTRNTGPGADSDFFYVEVNLQALK
jgi:hypothetical protein